MSKTDIFCLHLDHNSPKRFKSLSGFKCHVKAKHPSQHWTMVPHGPADELLKTVTRPYYTRAQVNKFEREHHA